MAKCKGCGKSGLFLKVNFFELCDSCVSKEHRELKEKIQELTTQTENQEKEITHLRDLMFPEHQERSDVRKDIENLKEECNRLDLILQNKKEILKKLETDISNGTSELIELKDETLVQSFGLYTPKYAFANAEEYKGQLDVIRERQKNKLKYQEAAQGSTKWTVDGSAAKGKKTIVGFQKLLVRAFNIECENLVDKVTYRNYETSRKRIESTYSTINKIGATLDVSISKEYKNLKLQELDLAYEYAHKKQEEKEEQKQIRAQMREEARIQKELEEERIKLEKEQTHYLNALAKIESQLIKNPDDADLMKKKDELAQKCDEIDRAIKDVDYREANKRAGYVYVISNIGAFGEGVYKIGMTRRLDPMERIDELGDASVPFKFDVHAMIFSEDAPALESALHKAFDDRKVNMVNARKEFFRVPLEEIKKVIRQNYDKTVEFIDLPDAEQYRVSEKMRLAV